MRISLTDREIDYLEIMNEIDRISESPEEAKRLKEEFKLIMKEHTLNHDRKDLRKL